MQKCHVPNEKYVFFPTHLSCKCLSVSAFADFPLHYSQSYTVRIDASVSGYRDQRNSRTLALVLPLLPFFIHCSCTDGGYCFDSVDGEQDVEEGSAHHCWWVGAKDALFFKHMKKNHKLGLWGLSQNTLLFLLHFILYPKPIHFTVTKQIIIRTQSLTSSIFFCISFSWLSHSLLSMSNLSSSSALSRDQSLSLCSRRQRRSIAVECVSSRSLRCSSLSRRSVDASPRCSWAPCADWISPALSLASNWRERKKTGSAEGTEEEREGRWKRERVGETLGKTVSGAKW